MPPTEQKSEQNPSLEDQIQAISEKLDAQTQKIDATLASIEKIRKNASIALWITVITIVLPIIILMFIGPSFMEGYMQSLQLSQ